MTKTFAGNMKILAGLDKNYFDRQVEISRLEWVKECMRNEEGEAGNAVKLMVRFAVKQHLEKGWWLEKDAIEALKN